MMANPIRLVISERFWTTLMREIPTYFRKWPKAYFPAGQTDGAMTGPEVMGSYPGSRPGTENSGKTLMTVPIGGPESAMKIEDMVISIMNRNSKTENVRLLAHLIRVFSSWLFEELRPGIPQEEIEVVVKIWEHWADDWTKLTIREKKGMLEIEEVTE